MKTDLFYPDTGRAATAAAMADPQPGDRFTEMWAFYVFVLKREGQSVTFLEFNPPGALPHDGKVGRLPVEEFQKRYAYRAIPGYWIRLIDRGNDVAGWEEVAQPMTVEAEA